MCPPGKGGRQGVVVGGESGRTGWTGRVDQTADPTLVQSGTLLLGEDLLLVGEDLLLVGEELVQLDLIVLDRLLVGEDRGLVGEDLLLVSNSLGRP